MKISVVIPTYNRPKDLEQTMSSILKQTLLPDEVVIVDQSDNDFTKILVNEISCRTNRIKFTWHFLKEKGTARARNEGFRKTTGDLICFTDDDVILLEDYFEKLLFHFNNSPDIGGIGGNVQVSNPPTGIKWAFRCFLMRLFLVDFYDARMTISGFGYPIYYNEIDKATTVELLSGYSMNFRRAYFERNQFDEWFTGYSFREDVDLSYRISRETKLIMVPDVRCIHNFSISARTDQKKLKRMQFKNYYYVFMKNKYTGWLSKGLFYYSLIGIIFIDFIEWLSGFKSDKFLSLSADLESFFGLLKGSL